MAFYYGIHNVAQHLMSAFGGKAGITPAAQCPLITQSGHRSAFMVLGFGKYPHLTKSAGATRETSYRSTNRSSRRRSRSSVIRQVAM